MKPEKGKPREEKRKKEVEDGKNKDVNPLFRKMKVEKKIQ